MESDLDLFEYGRMVVNAASLAVMDQDLEDLEDIYASSDNDYAVIHGMTSKNNERADSNQEHGDDDQQAPLIRQRNTHTVQSPTAIVIKPCQARAIQVPDPILSAELFFRGHSQYPNQHYNLRSIPKNADDHDFENINTPENEDQEQESEGLSSSLPHVFSPSERELHDKRRTPNPQSKYGVQLTGDTVDIVAGELVFVDIKSVPNGLDHVVVTDSLSRRLLVPRHHLQLYGDPRGENWFFPVPIASNQATLILNRINVPGCFLVYRSTAGHNDVPYNISVLVENDVVRTHHICKSANNELFITRDHKFLTIIDLITYYKRSRGILACRLRRSPIEFAQPELLLVGLETRHLLDEKCLEVDNDSDHSGMSCGYFGEVIRGFYKKQKVAIKTPKKLDNPWALDDFLGEVRITCRLQHPHILRYIGLIPKLNSLRLVSEYIECGDLQSGLKQGIFQSGDSKQLLEMFSQILSALKYLASISYIVHRDLATRNCLLNDLMQLKLCDFGMARHVHDNTYIADVNEKVSVRWASPEVLHNLHYSTSSDIWAAGVLLWEICSGGALPYEELNNSKVTQFIMAGEVLPAPNSCPEEVYQLMKMCWHFTSDMRPSAEALIERVQQEHYQTRANNITVDDSRATTNKRDTDDMISSASNIGEGRETDPQYKRLMQVFKKKKPKKKK